MVSINPADAIGGETMRSLEVGARMFDHHPKLRAALGLPPLELAKPDNRFPRDAEVANYLASLRHGGAPIAQRLDSPGAPRGEHVGQR
jgi:hypothetical protein